MKVLILHILKSQIISLLFTRSLLSQSSLRYIRLHISSLMHNIRRSVGVHNTQLAGMFQTLLL